MLPILSASCVFLVLKTLAQQALLTRQQIIVLENEALLDKGDISIFQNYDDFPEIMKLRGARSGRSFIHLAAMHCDIGMIDQSMIYGQSIFDSDFAGQLPLHYAARACCFDGYNYLQNMGADPRALDLNNISALDEMRYHCH
jgi:hypothetical protein